MYIYMFIIYIYINTYIHIYIYTHGSFLSELISKCALGRDGTRRNGTRCDETRQDKAVRVSFICGIRVVKGVLVRMHAAVAVLCSC